MTRTTHFSRWLTVAALVAHLLPASLQALELSVLDPVPGSYDASFGSDRSGRIHPFEITAGGATFRNAIAAQPDRKLVIAGGCGSPWKFCAARLLDDGAFDPAFSADSLTPGRLTIDFDGSAVESYAVAIATQSDGKLLLAGDCIAPDQQATACIVRLLPDGRRDPAFVGPAGTAQGAFLLPMGGRSVSITSLIAQPDDKILMFGSCVTLSGAVATCGARLLEDGSLDSSFVGPAGTGDGRFVYSLSGSNDDAPRVQQRADQKIVIAMTCYDDPQAPGEPRACLTLLDEAGRIDASFNANVSPGHIRHITAGVGGFTLVAITLQADGKFVLLGHCYPAATAARAPCFVRYLPEGILDPSFVGPTRLGRGSFVVALSGAGRLADAHDLVQQSDGKLVMSGRCSSIVEDGRSGVCLARLHGDGTFDTSFDGPNPQSPGNGSFLQVLPWNDWGLPRIALQADGKIAQVYYCRTDAFAPPRMCVARIHGGPRTGPRCTLDVDGDGVGATVGDILIAMRAVTGMSGAAVREGIEFSPAATRLAWDRFHTYLTRECGLPLGENTRK